jgi:hypothetical protein
MTQLKRFLALQVEAVQEQLRELLLVHPEEERAAIVPPLNLRSLKDDPSKDQPGWSFLTDPRNVALQGNDRWLLDRVLDYDWLQAEFLSAPGSSLWNRHRAEQYLKQVDAFLERLLLVVHIVSGQPARGTELLSLQLCNTRQGLRRSVFIENGLVSFVTVYHKGYSISGSTKIIHRYLPKEVSELLVYYVWLVLPFCRQLRMLALDEAVITPTFLWPIVKGGKSEPWLSSRLTEVLKSQFKMHLDTEARILTWRHAAIAINRKHLPQAKFKKDYGIDVGSTTWNDEQAAHPAKLAGSIYARGIEEAPGHVEAARAEYRQISRAWHSWLGFALYLSDYEGAHKGGTGL